MRKYELMIILNPSLGEQGINTLLDEVRTEVKAHGSKIASEDLWGVRDLAYKINNSTTGYYALITLETEGNGFFEVSNSFNLKKDIWRYMFVKIED